MNAVTTDRTTYLPHGRSRGFTLIELMITVAIIGILAGVALPAYTKYIQKSRRADAKNAVLDLAAREERYYSINNKYSSDPEALGYGKGTTFPMNISISGSANYQLNFTASSVTATAFEAIAVPVGTQVKDTTCYTYAVNQQGVQTNKDSGGAKITANTGCW